MTRTFCLFAEIGDAVQSYPVHGSALPLVRNNLQGPRASELIFKRRRDLMLYPPRAHSKSFSIFLVVLRPRARRPISLRIFHFR